MSRTLTLLRQVVLLCFTLHVFAPALQAFGLTVKKLHEPAAVTPEGWHAARLGCFVSGFHQPGFGLRAGRPAGGPVILPVAEEALRPYGPHHVVLCRCAGFRVPLEASKLQTLVFCGRKTLQLQIRLNCCRYAVGPFEAAESEKEQAASFNTSCVLQMCIYFHINYVCLFHQLSLFAKLVVLKWLLICNHLVFWVSFKFGVNGKKE